MSESTSYSHLICGTNPPPATLPGTVRVYESFSAGQILGRLTATGKWQVIDASNKSGCNLFGVALDAIDTTAGTEKPTTILVQGEVNAAYLLYGYDDGLSDWSPTLEAQGLFPRDSVSTSGT
jgi:hypothetical protein